MSAGDNHPPDNSDAPPGRFTPCLEPTFHGSKPPRWELEREFPWHRAAALCFARGATSKEVARSLGKSEPAVQNLIKQPWFQKEVTTLMEGYGHRDLAALFQAEQFNSLTTLTELRDNPRVPASARIACARDILDRALGKPVQRVETLGLPVSSDPVAEVAQLKDEINRLHKEVQP